MAFPVVQSTNTSAESSTTTTHTIALPSGIQEGDLLIFTFREGVGVQPSEPSGWTRTSSNNTGGFYSVFYKTAGASEPSTVEVTTSLTISSSHISYRISGWEDIELTISNNTVRPPSLTASWGADDNLWIAGTSTRRGNREFTDPPSNYSNLLTISTDPSATTTGNSVSATAQRNLNTATEHPGEFTMGSSGADNPKSVTIAILGAEPSFNPTIMTHMQIAGGIM
jgi:hypothetical protein